MPIANWEINREEFDLLILIAGRAIRELTDYPDDKRTLIMDLWACHSNACPLDFAGLLAAPMLDFSHDICGIRDHINRDTGALDDGEGPFMPRYALANHVSREEYRCNCVRCGHSWIAMSKPGPSPTPELGFISNPPRCAACKSVAWHEGNWDVPVSTLPGGVVVTGGTDEQHDLLRRRGAFVAQYCAAKNWDASNVTMEQLLEIRNQQGWKEPQK